MSNNLSSTSKIIVILGSTASGKSKLAVKLAKKFNAEIISADSRQVYKGLDIGTEKIRKSERQGIKHHLIDVTAPQKIYTVTQYQKTAKKILRQIFKKNLPAGRQGKIPIIVGGSGFYIDALIYNYKLPEVPPQPKLRKQLEKKSVDKLFKQLKKLDPRRAKTIDKNNPRRLIRSLEIILTTGKHIPPLTKLVRRPSGKFSKYNFLKIGIKKSPKELRRLINQRLEKTLKRGLIEETKKLHQKGLSWQRLEELGMEYRLVSYYLRGLISRHQMISQMQREIYRYAKRQMTWFKRDKSIKWIKNYQEAAAIVKKFIPD
jgi:tRNA dimethylallyltransferase